MAIVAPAALCVPPVQPDQRHAITPTERGLSLFSTEAAQGGHGCPFGLDIAGAPGLLNGGFRLLYRYFLNHVLMILRHTPEGALRGCGRNGGAS